MARTSIKEEKLKEVLKDAIVELFEERRDLFYDLLAEVVEDMAMAHAAKAAEEFDPSGRKNVFRIQKGEA